MDIKSRKIDLEEKLDYLNIIEGLLDIIKDLCSKQYNEKADEIYYRIISNVEEYENDDYIFRLSYHEKEVGISEKELNTVTLEAEMD